MDIVEEFRKGRSLYVAFTDECERLAQTLLSQYAIQYHKVEKRTKSLEKLAEKVGRDGKSYDSLTEITDLSGIRIITFFADDAPDISELIHENFEVDEAESVDKGAQLSPDRFGYVSEHFVVTFTADRCLLADFKMYTGLKCEIQVRSILQHAWAEIEHDLGYKAAIDVPPPIRRRFSQLAGLFEIADDEFMRIREDLAKYSTEVEKQVADETTELVELNVTSLQIAIKNSKTIRELDQQIGDATGQGFSPDKDLSDTSLSREIQQLIELEVLGIGRLEDLIRVHGGGIRNFAQKWVTDPVREPYYSGISIFFLIYALLATTRDVDYTADFFDRYHPEWTDNRTTAEDLFGLWDEITKGQ